MNWYYLERESQNRSKDILKEIENDLIIKEILNHKKSSPVSRLRNWTSKKIIRVGHSLLVHFGFAQSSLSRTKTQSYDNILHP